MKQPATTTIDTRADLRLRLPKPLYDAIRQLAEAEDRPVTVWVKRALERLVADAAREATSAEKRENERIARDGVKRLRDRERVPKKPSLATP